VFVCVCVCVSLSSTLSLLARSTDSTLQTPRPPHSSRAVYVYHKVLARREAWGGRGGGHGSFVTKSSAFSSANPPPLLARTPPPPLPKSIHLH
jgi:hypothetical protein